MPLSNRLCILRIRYELDHLRPGARTIASDLASALFVMMLRAHFDADTCQGGALALLSQQATARVFLAMLDQPSRNWTLDMLADIGGMSRATLVRTFHRICGMTPLTYLADLRLGVARRRLVDSADPIAQVAAEVGYQSEAALSRAFHRRFGIRLARYATAHNVDE